jgi:hypothetical protein
MIVGTVAGQACRDLVKGKFREHGNAIECLLTVHCNIVSERFERLAWKNIVNTLGLLQADDVRLALREPRGQIVHSLLDRIHVPGGDAHGAKTRVWARVQLDVTKPDAAPDVGVVAKVTPIL